MDTLKDRIIRARAPLKRIGLENRDFSILANNCWGGIVSRDRRKKRIRWDNLLVKYSDQNGFVPEDFETFRALPFANRLFLTTNPEYRSEFTRVIPDKWHEGYAVDDIKSSFRVMDVNRLLNEMIRGNND